MENNNQEEIVVETVESLKDEKLKVQNRLYAMENIILELKANNPDLKIPTLAEIVAKHGNLKEYTDRFGDSK